MSSAPLDLTIAAASADQQTPSNPSSWLDRFLPRCSATGCRRAHKLFPAYRRRAAGILLDGRWYCGPQCLETVLALRVQNLVSSFSPPKPRIYRVPIGLLLVGRGVISYAQLQQALRRQREAHHGRMGDWLRQLGFVSDAQLIAALAQQWGCPVFPLTNPHLAGLLPSLAPFALFQSAHAVPVHNSPDGRLLHVAFSERIDHTLLYALEQMLSARTVGCVATDSSITAALESISALAPREEIVFDTLRDARGITATVISYAEELRTEKMILARAGSFLWTRFFRADTSRDLLFRILAPQSSTLEQVAPPANVNSSSADSRNVGISAVPGVV